MRLKLVKFTPQKDGDRYGQLNEAKTKKWDGYQWRSLDAWDRRKESKKKNKFTRHREMSNFLNTKDL